MVRIFSQSASRNSAFSPPLPKVGKRNGRELGVRRSFRTKRKPSSNTARNVEPSRLANCCERFKRSSAISMVVFTMGHPYAVVWELRLPSFRSIFQWDHRREATSPNAAERLRISGPARTRTEDQGIHFCPAVSGGSGLSLHPSGVRDALACH